MKNVKEAARDLIASVKGHVSDSNNKDERGMAELTRRSKEVERRLEVVNRNKEGPKAEAEHGQRASVLDFNIIAPKEEEE